MNSERWLRAKALFQAARGANEAMWTPTPDGSTSEEAARWSVHGNWIYALSNPDTFDCICAYPVDPRTKKPSGEPTAVFHSHGSRLSLRNANQISRDLAVGRNRIVFNQGEIIGNIWMTEISQWRLLRD